MNSFEAYRLLEQRFDGEIPEHLRRAALAGGSDTLEGALARANSRRCDGLALAAVRLSATHRASLSDLDTWRREGLAWFTWEAGRTGQKAAWSGR